MIIFIDFDDVLFNTKRFKEDLQNLFFQHGISREIFDKYYYSKSLVNTKVYDPWNHLEMISQGEGIDVEKAKKDMEEFMIDTNPYLFDDSVDFLKYFKNDYICIVSYGESQVQSMKIAECRVGKYCEEVEVTNQLKSTVIEKKLGDYKSQDKKVFFIDDRVEHIEEVKKKFPFVKSIFMKRPERRYYDEATEFCDFEADNLEEARKIITSN